MASLRRARPPGASTDYASSADDSKWAPLRRRRPKFAHEIRPGTHGGVFWRLPGAEARLQHADFRFPVRRWKNAIDCRRALPPFSGVGLTTRCSVETQRSLVQRAMRSPMLMTKALACGGTGVQAPSGVRISKPREPGCGRSIVRLP